MIRWWLEPQHALSSEIWNGGSGTVTFNFLQQRPAEGVGEDVPAVATDLWGVTDGGFRG